MLGLSGSCRVDADWHSDLEKDSYMAADFHRYLTISGAKSTTLRDAAEGHRLASGAAWPILRLPRDVVRILLGS